MFKTIFKISKMDCASEEQLIRMKLDGRNEIKNLDFDIPNRKLTIVHTGESNEINNLLRELNLGSELVSNTETDEPVNIIQTNKKERKMLWTVLIINISFFVIEIITGFITNSMGLVADSLDMLADGIVYGLALLAVGGTVARKKNIAKFAGYFQIVLALIGFTEVVRRFIGIEKMPDFQTMIIVSIFALIANVICFCCKKARAKKHICKQV